MLSRRNASWAAAGEDVLRIQAVQIYTRHAFLSVTQKVTLPYKLSIHIVEISSKLYSRFVKKAERGIVESSRFPINVLPTLAVQQFVDLITD